jgi:hypothetical protein
MTKTELERRETPGPPARKPEMAPEVFHEAVFEFFLLAVGWIVALVIGGYFTLVLKLATGNFRNMFTPDAAILTFVFEQLPALAVIFMAFFTRCVVKKWRRA